MMRTLMLTIALGMHWLAAAADQPTVQIATTLGNIVVAIDADHAPVSAANFLRYVDQKFYDGGVFHRTVTLRDGRATGQHGGRVLRRL